MVDGSYDDAVRRSAALAGPRRLVLSDTSWPGYEEVPRWVIEGYATIFREVDEQIGGAPVDVAVVPIGVGALAAAAVRHLARPRAAGRRRAGGRRVHARVGRARVRSRRSPARTRSIMAGLNAGLPSLVAWPLVSAGFDLFCAIEDRSRSTGCGGSPASDSRRASARAAPSARPGGCSPTPALARPWARARPAVLVLLTEGVTDPDAYARLVGRRTRASLHAHDRT